MIVILFQDKDASDAPGGNVSVEMTLENDNKVNGDENGNCSHGISM